MHRLIVLISSLAALLFAVGSALADDPTNPLDACTAGGNVDANPKCVEDIYRATDRQLMDAVKTIVAKIESREDLPPDKAREWRDDLIAAEQAWETFRDKDCSGATSFEFLGGNGRSRAIALCYYGKTRDRLEELQQRYDLAGGRQ
jgi:uncharacterized protein YecT (DUF1311 family)